MGRLSSYSASYSLRLESDFGDEYVNEKAAPIRAGNLHRGLLVHLNNQDPNATVIFPFEIFEVASQSERYGPMKPLLVLVALSAIACGAPPAPAPVVDPPELVTLRDAYSASIAPLRSKVEEAIKARSAQYAADLKKIEDQAVSANRIEAIPLIRTEREAFASGSWTTGYPKDAKVPTAANELRRAFDRDANKIRSDIVPAARPLLNDYHRKLEDLEKQLLSKKESDAALAVRQERQSFQGAGADPLNGSNSLVLGKWFDEKGKDTEFYTDGKVDGGKWFWTDRPARALRINWNAGPKFHINLVISPDGSQMSGINASGGIRNFTRKKP
jgi:hypothetical protein